MAYADQVPGSHRFTTIAGVALIHGIIGYAFVTGMVVDVVRGVTRTLTTTNVPLPVEPPPPPQQRDLPKPDQPVRQATTTVTMVDLPKPVDPVWMGPPAILRTDPLPMATDMPVPQPVPSTTPASKASAARTKGVRSEWITTEDYPPSAIRAEEQGTVAITVAIDADGRVSSCTVTQSSGSAALDQATCRLYARRARFEAARDDSGARIASTYSDRVRWQLPR